MAKIVGVQFQKDGKMFYFDANGFDPAVGEYVIADTAFSVVGSPHASAECFAVVEICSVGVFVVFIIGRSVFSVKARGHTGNHDRGCLPDITPPLCERYS